MSTRTKHTGDRGEQAACDYLLGLGWTLLARNWRCTQGELDLVLREGDTIVVVEVKTRRSGAEAAFASLTPAKRARLINAMRHFLNAHALDDEPCRLDVIAVRFDAEGQHGGLTHARDVLTW